MMVMRGGITMRLFVAPAHSDREVSLIDRSPQLTAMSAARGPVDGLADRTRLSSCRRAREAGGASGVDEG
jgi:hypothetical protein